MPESSTNEPKEKTGLGDRSLFYSVLFQLLKKEANATELVVWKGQSEDQHPVFVCTVNGATPDSSHSDKKQKLIDRARTSKKSIISGRKSGDSSSPIIHNVEVYCALNDFEIAQIGFPEGRQKSEYEDYIKKTERLIESEFMVAADPSLAQTAVFPNSQTAPDAASNSIGTQPNREVVEFFRNINQSLNLKSTAFHISNDLRLVTNSDRVSVFRVRGRRPKAISVSGVSVVNRRSKDVRQLEQLVKKTIRLGRVFTYPLETQPELPRRLESTLSEYLAEQSTRSLMIVPVTERKENTSKTDPSELNQRRRKPRIIGAFAIEYFQRQVVENKLISQNEQYGHCAGDAFRNAFLHQRLFLYPVWHQLGKAYEFFVGRHLSKTVVGVAAVLIAAFAVTVLQTEYRLSCQGELRPESQRTVYAEIDGLITEVLTDTGDSVESGELLLQLENKDLLIRQQELQGNMKALSERIESIDRFSVGDPRNPNQASDNSDQLALERSGLQKQIETMVAQLEIVDRQIEMQVVHSPIQGEVLTTNLQQELADRPVSRGAKLLDIAATEGQWVVDLKLADRKIGELLKAQQEFGESLSVVFVLASEPERKYVGVLKSTELKTETDDEIGQFLRILVDIDEDQLANAKVGTEVIAYVQCGQRSYGFIWTKEIVDFVRKRILFPLW